MRALLEQGGTGRYRGLWPRGRRSRSDGGGGRTAIVMERAIAERGRYPAINVLKSVSRSMPRSADPAYLDVLARARKVMATYADMEELIRLAPTGPAPALRSTSHRPPPRPGGVFGPRQGGMHQPDRGISASGANPAGSGARSAARNTHQIIGLGSVAKKNPVPYRCGRVGNRKLTLSRQTRLGCP